MAENTTPTPDRLDTIEARLRRLEEMVGRSANPETAVEPWQYLVRRRHPWRTQLYVKGRNLTARQLPQTHGTRRKGPTSLLRKARGGLSDSDLEREVGASVKTTPNEYLIAVSQLLLIYDRCPGVFELFFDDNRARVEILR